MTLALLMSDVVFRMTALTGVGLVKQSLLVLLSLCAHAQGIRLLGSSTLGKDPQTVNRLNGESFQQDALVTHGGE